jgi:hypothetical protein
MSRDGKFDYIGQKVTARVYGPEGNTVKIELIVECGGAYEAQVFHEDLSARLGSGKEKIGITMHDAGEGGVAAEAVHVL